MEKLEDGEAGMVGGAWELMKQGCQEGAPGRRCQSSLGLCSAGRRGQGLL